MIGSIVGIIVIIGVAVGVGVGVSQSKSSSNKSADGSGSGSSGSGSGSGSSSSGDPSDFEKNPALKQSFYGIAYTPEGSQLPECGNSIGAYAQELIQRYLGVLMDMYDVQTK